MGGLLAVALAQRRPDLVAALVSMATPWDFHAERADAGAAPGPAGEPLVESFAALGEVPVDVLQMFFLANDPLTAAQEIHPSRDDGSRQRCRTPLCRARGLAQ